MTTSEAKSILFNMMADKLAQTLASSAKADRCGRPDYKTALREKSAKAASEAAALSIVLKAAGL